MAGEDPKQPGLADLEAVLLALELVEQRLDRMEGEVRVMAETMTEIVRHLELLQARIHGTDRGDA